MKAGCFELTPDGERLMRYLHEEVGFWDDLRNGRQWCEWQVQRWGWEGGLEFAKRMIAYVRARARNPAAYMYYLMWEKHEIQWMPDDEYREFKRKYDAEYKRYQEWRVEWHRTSPDSVQGVLNRLMEEYESRQEASQPERPPEDDEASVSEW